MRGGGGGERKREREGAREEGSSVVVVLESRVDEGTGLLAVADSCRLPGSTIKTSRLLRQPARGSALD